MSTPELRKKWREHFKECGRIIMKYDSERECEWNEYIQNPVKKSAPTYPIIRLPKFPEELRGMTCGAQNRKGKPCGMRQIFISGRCKFHGGLSTGPKTKEGKKRSSMNGFKSKGSERVNKVHER